MSRNEIPRAVTDRVHDRLAHSPAVVLLGPRQVGKTTLARRLAADWPSGAQYLDMERPADRRRLEDPDAYVRRHVFDTKQLVIIDEIHRVPDLFAVLRGVIDDARAAGRRTGLFLLLGSAAIELMRQASETLAGRAAYVDMTPLTHAETQREPHAIGTDRLWLRGGFPDSLLAPSDTASLDWRRDFVRAYLERDVPMFAPRLPAESVGRLWTMLAHNQGAMLNQSRLAQALGVSSPAVARYIDLLVDLKLVRRLQPWSGNPGKRLVKAPKVYVRDSGLVHALLEIDDLDALLGHPVAGHSYEGFAIENLVAAAGDRHRPYFYRSHDGAEIDLLLERGGKPDTAIEIKRSSAPTLDKGFSTACDDLGVTRRFVVYPGTETFALRYGAQAVSLAQACEAVQD